jgi:hypothetical protein
LRRVVHRGLLSLLAVLALPISGCRREPPSNVDRNRAPETYITRAPAESTLAYYRVRMYWGGSDPDGAIAYYEIAVTDSNEIPGEDLEEGTGYTRTLRTDSLFTLSADPPVEQQVMGHRLYVRAVDNEGKLDPTPALAYFVAINDYFPQVVFTGDSGHWIDGCGTARERVFTGHDTIGVEGSVRWTWTGFDQDQGGSVVGYVWKMASQTGYSGGGLGDTLAEITFPPNASRRQTLQVRAIDDGGLRSRDDFTQVVILNFDPITLVLDPADTLDGTPTRGLYFKSYEKVWPSGTTLPDSGNVRSVTILFTGYDDPRDKGACNGTGVHKYEARVASRDDKVGSPAGTPYSRVAADQPYPTINQNPFYNLPSGDHFILIRSVDDYGVVDSSPETVVVKINYSPYLTQFDARGSASPPESAINLLAVRNSSPSRPIDIQLAPGESLEVIVRGQDTHFPDPMNPPAPFEPDPLAAAYDSNYVVQPEIGIVNPLNGYRVFFDSLMEPGYEPADSTGVFAARLEVPRSAVYMLTADVQDKTNTNAVGRRSRVIRWVRVQFSTAAVVARP